MGIVHTLITAGLQELKADADVLHGKNQHRKDSMTTITEDTERLCDYIVNSKEGTTVKGPIETMAFELAHRIMHEPQGTPMTCEHGNCGGCGNMKLYNRDQCIKCRHSDLDKSMACRYTHKSPA